MFMKNRKNQLALINSMVKYTSLNMKNLLNRLKIKNIYFSTDSKTLCFANGLDHRVVELSSNIEEEEDTKVIYLML